MNDEKHLRELIQTVLDGKPLQSNITGGWSDCVERPIITRIAKIVEYGASSYRIKPEVKTFTYQTRVYMANETMRVWSSADYMDKKELQLFYKNSHFKWLAPAQTHIIKLKE